MRWAVSNSPIDNTPYCGYYIKRLQDYHTNQSVR